MFRLGSSSVVVNEPGPHPLHSLPSPEFLLPSLPPGPLHITRPPAANQKKTSAPARTMMSTAPPPSTHPNGPSTPGAPNPRAQPITRPPKRFFYRESSGLCMQGSFDDELALGAGGRRDARIGLCGCIEFATTVGVFQMILFLLSAFFWTGFRCAGRGWGSDSGALAPGSSGQRWWGRGCQDRLWGRCDGRGVVRSRP